MYDQMDSADKIDYLKVKIQQYEQSLRERTDHTLQSQRAFDLILDNQRFFAVCQDKFSNLAKKAREEVALRSVREVNDLICQRKNLQIEAFRLTENFKIKVNSMAQKEVEDIFAKTMKKNQFKASSTLRLARTFLQKHKVMTTWRAKDHMNALAEVADEQDEQELEPQRLDLEQQQRPAGEQAGWRPTPPQLIHLDKLTTLPREGRAEKVATEHAEEGEGLSADDGHNSEDSEAHTEGSQRQRKITEEPPSSSVAAETPLNESQGAGAASKH